MNVSDWRMKILCVALLIAVVVPARAKADELRQCNPRKLEASLFNPDGDPALRQKNLETTTAAASSSAACRGIPRCSPG